MKKTTELQKPILKVIIHGSEKYYEITKAAINVPGKGTVTREKLQLIEYAPIVNHLINIGSSMLRELDFFEVQKLKNKGGE